MTSNLRNKSRLSKNRQADKRSKCANNAIPPRIAGSRASHLYVQWMAMDGADGGQCHQSARWKLLARLLRATPSLGGPFCRRLRTPGPPIDLIVVAFTPVDIDRLPLGCRPISWQRALVHHLTAATRLQKTRFCRSRQPPICC